MPPQANNDAAAGSVNDAMGCGLLVEEDRDGTILVLRLPYLLRATLDGGPTAFFVGVATVIVMRRTRVQLCPRRSVL